MATTHGPHILVFDVEATGGNVMEHQIVAVGAALIDVVSARTVWAEQRFVRRALLTAWEPRCQIEFWSTPQAQAVLCLTDAPDALDFEELAAWVAGTIRTAYDASSGVLELATDNPVFDGTFLDVLLTRHGLRPLKYTIEGRYLSVLDTDSFETGVTAARRPQKLDLKVDAPPHDHMPAHDAVHIGMRHIAVLAAVQGV